MASVFVKMLAILFIGGLFFGLVGCSVNDGKIIIFMSSGVGYRIEIVNNDSVVFERGASILFRVSVLEGYCGEDKRVSFNGEAVAPLDDGSLFYVNNLSLNSNIAVRGVVRSGERVTPCGKCEQENCVCEYSSSCDYCAGGEDGSCAGDGDGLGLPSDSPSDSCGGENEYLCGCGDDECLCECEGCECCYDTYPGPGALCEAFGVTFVFERECPWFVDGENDALAKKGRNFHFTVRHFQLQDFVRVYFSVGDGGARQPLEANLEKACYHFYIPYRYITGEIVVFVVLLDA